MKSQRLSAHRAVKTAFLRTLNRMNDVILRTRVEGVVNIGGRDIYGTRVDVVELRREVGMVFQKSNPFQKRIFDTLAYGARVNGTLSKFQLKACG